MTYRVYSVVVLDPEICFCVVRKYLGSGIVYQHIPGAIVGAIGRNKLVD